MLLAQVVGTVVASRKEPLLEGLKMMAVQPVDGAGQAVGAPVVAIDSVGAGPGELVLLVAGSSARYTHATKDRPADLTILAIVDEVDLNGTLAYLKASAAPRSADVPGAAGKSPAGRSAPARPPGA